MTDKHIYVTSITWTMASLALPGASQAIVDVCPVVCPQFNALSLQGRYGNLQL